LTIVEQQANPQQPIVKRTTTSSDRTIDPSTATAIKQAIHRPTRREASTDPQADRRNKHRQQRSNNRSAAPIHKPIDSTVQQQQQQQRAAAP
jgi:hypothetical protein